MKPKKQKFNIAINSGPKEVEGEMVIVPFVKAFIHRSPENKKFWVVTEWRTGRALSWPHRTKEKAIKDATERLMKVGIENATHRINHGTQINFESEE